MKYKEMVPPTEEQRRRIRVEQMIHSQQECRDRQDVSDMLAVAACLTERVEAVQAAVRDPDPMHFSGRLAVELAFQSVPVRRAGWRKRSYIIVDVVTAGVMLVSRAAGDDGQCPADLSEDDLSATDWELLNVITDRGGTAEESSAVVLK